MKIYLRVAGTILLFLSLPNGHILALDNDAVSPEQARTKIGKTATVCGKVVDTYYARQSNGEPTFLNFGRRHPNQVFTVVIFGENRSQFQAPPEKLYDGQAICVKGLIGTYQGTPQIEVTASSQITFAGNGRPKYGLDYLLDVVASFFKSLFQLIQDIWS